MNFEKKAIFLASKCPSLLHHSKPVLGGLLSKDFKKSMQAKVNELMKLNLLQKRLPIEIILDLQVTTNQNITSEHCFVFL